MSNPIPSPLVHLVRHGEVHNPDHVVYADLPGYGLSASGRTQVIETATYLARFPIGLVVTSPLRRAIETAGLIAGRHGIGVVVDERLTEWRLSTLWAGIAWDELDDVRPGELTAYLAHPEHLSFSPESLAAAGLRVAEAARHHSSGAHGDVVVVSHQDPIHAGVRTLLGTGLGDFGADKPAHATVVSLDPGRDPWERAARFDPTQGAMFPPGDD